MCREKVDGDFFFLAFALELVFHIIKALRSTLRVGSALKLDV